MSDATGAAPAGAVEEAAPAEAVPAIENNVSEEERAATGAREAVADAAPPLAAPTNAVVVAKEPTPTPPAPPPPPAAPPAAQPSAGGVYGRSLTEKEQLLIAQRVREQQAAFRAWEEREAKRKVRMQRHANSRFPPLTPPTLALLFSSTSTSSLSHSLTRNRRNPENLKKNARTQIAELRELIPALDADDVAAAALAAAGDSVEAALDACAARPSFVQQMRALCGRAPLAPALVEARRRAAEEEAGDGGGGGEGGRGEEGGDGERGGGGGSGAGGGSGGELQQQRQQQQQRGGGRQQQRPPKRARAPRAPSSTVDENEEEDGGDGDDDDDAAADDSSDGGARRRGSKRRPAAAELALAAAAPRRRATRPPPRAPAPLSSSSPSPLPTRKPLLGRVKRCSSKCSTLLSLGVLRREPGWHNTGYIFPDGFSSSTRFRSSERIGDQVEHVCSVVGAGGAHWPLPTFVVTAADRPDEPLAARSATGAWSAVLARIAQRIRERIERGEALPPPPRTAIAGPEYFGLTQHAPAIEALDPGRELCALYWAGKAEREAFVAAYGDAPDKKVVQVVSADSGRAAAPAAPAPREPAETCAPAPRRVTPAPKSNTSGPAAERRARARARAAAAAAAAAAAPPRPQPPPPPPPPPQRQQPRYHPDSGDDDENNGRVVGMPGPWSAFERGDRAKRRAEKVAAAERAAAAAAAAAAAPSGGGENAPATAAAAAAAAPPSAAPPSSPPPLLPGVLDPITMEPVRDPAVCPHGHVMGATTWAAVLAEGGGVCPLSRERVGPGMLTRLTEANIGRWRDRLVTMDA